MSEDIRAILNDLARLNEVTKEVFDQTDTDASGFVDKAELKAALISVSTECGLPPPSDEKIAASFTALDIDNSGTLDVAEFSVLIRKLLESLLE